MRKKLPRKSCATPPPDIHESFRLDRSYRYGIGLEIVVNSPIVDQTVIERCIRRFQELGETDWQSSDPISRDQLDPISPGIFLLGQSPSYS